MYDCRSNVLSLMIKRKYLLLICLLLIAWGFSYIANFSTSNEQFSQPAVIIKKVDDCPPKQNLKNSLVYQPSPKFISIDDNLVLIDAFLRFSNEIWILAARNSFRFSNQKCLFCYQKDGSECWTEEIKHKYNPFIETHGLPYSTQIMVCLLSRKSLDFDFLQVTISGIQDEDHFKKFFYERPHLFSIIKQSTFDPSNKDISVCTGPHWGFDRSTDELWEWMEYQYLMGARRIRFYLSKDVSLNFIREIVHFSQYKADTANLSNFVEIIEWNNLPDNQMHYRSQVALVNHCIFLSQKDSEYVFVNDIDEFVYPVHEKDWRSGILPKFDHQTGSIRYKNWFYDKTCILDNQTLLSMGAFIRAVEPWTSGREKYVVRPSTVQFAGIHMVVDFLSEFRSITLPESEAHLVHYTTYITTKGCDHLSGERQLDQGMKRFGEELRKSKLRYQSLEYSPLGQNVRI